ncbi:hypothetical protein [Crenobacter cavernae]|uniref:Uncharacterized protein n=1 Tax=Crenobacter cavernae TaxID=2290923 RepID=A0ABY0FDH9_9NEIS|nr:hypothetical protein [Crenobacter cavernae]RXZ42673.1 hypothetical protein EBB06_12315 [Crenobacter cavernae]
MYTITYVDPMTRQVETSNFASAEIFMAMGPVTIKRFEKFDSEGRCVAGSSGMNAGPDFFETM